MNHPNLDQTLFLDFSPHLLLISLHQSQP
uniref:Uncharacterized protein n=1 Tax=Arundo donax TaxID=35708 RepID=A0A0A9GT33_ARUDO